MTRLFMICTDVIYPDEWSDWSLNETVIIDVFESENRKEASKRTARESLDSPLIQSRLSKAGFNVNYDLKPRLDFHQTYAVQASVSLLTSFPNILPALKVYCDEVNGNKPIRTRILKAIGRIEKSKLPI